MAFLLGLIGVGYLSIKANQVVDSIGKTGLKILDMKDKAVENISERFRKHKNKHMEIEQEIIRNRRESMKKKYNL